MCHTISFTVLNQGKENKIVTCKVRGKGVTIMTQNSDLYFGLTSLQAPHASQIPLAFLVRQHDLFVIPCIKLTSQNDYTRKPCPYSSKPSHYSFTFHKKPHNLHRSHMLDFLCFPLQDILISEQVFKHRFYFWIKRESLSYHG